MKGAGSAIAAGRFAGVVALLVVLGGLAAGGLRSYVRHLDPQMKAAREEAAAVFGKLLARLDGGAEYMAIDTAGRRILAPAELADSMERAGFGFKDTLKLALDGVKFSVARSTEPVSYGTYALCCAEGMLPVTLNLADGHSDEALKPVGVTLKIGVKCGVAVSRLAVKPFSNYRYATFGDLDGKDSARAVRMYEKLCIAAQDAIGKGKSGLNRGDSLLKGNGRPKRTLDSLEQGKASGRIGGIDDGGMRRAFPNRAWMRKDAACLPRRMAGRA